MPVVQVVSNASASHENKLQLVAAIGSAIAETCRTPKEHVHVHILDGQFFAFGGDANSPAACITIQASSSQILEESRKEIVDKLIPVVSEVFGCASYRTTTFFIDHPVENIAVGTQIMMFASPRAKDASGTRFQ